MVTGEHVEVFREAALPGERRRYTKRFLATAGGDFRAVDRARVAHPRAPGRPRHRAACRTSCSSIAARAGRPALVQTYDAGVTVDHWATLLPVERDGARAAPRVRGLRALVGARAPLPGRARRDPRAAARAPRPQGRQRLHPGRPADFDPQRARRSCCSRASTQLALIDFAFSLVSRREPRRRALPIGGRPTTTTSRRACCSALEAGRRGDLRPTRAARLALRHVQPGGDAAALPARARGRDGRRAGRAPRHAQARALVRRLRRGARRRAAGAAAARRADRARRRDARATPSCGVAAARLDAGARPAASRRRRSPTPVTRIALPVMAPATPTAAVVPIAVAATPVAMAVTPVAATPTTRPVNLPMATPLAARAPAAAPSSPPTVSAAPLRETRPIGPAAAAEATPPSPATQPVTMAKPADAANEALAVDPTDVAMRMQTRRREREQRTRRIVAASALAAGVVVATAAAAWLEPTWRPLLGSPHVQLAGTDAATPAAAPRDEAKVAMAPPAAPANADTETPSRSGPEPGARGRSRPGDEPAGSADARCRPRRIAEGRTGGRGQGRCEGADAVRDDPGAAGTGPIAVVRVDDGGDGSNQQDAAASCRSAGAQSTCRAGTVAFRACRQRAQRDSVSVAAVSPCAKQRRERHRGSPERGTAVACFAGHRADSPARAPDRPTARRFRGRWPGAPRRA